MLPLGIDSNCNSNSVGPSQDLDPDFCLPETYVVGGGGTLRDADETLGLFAFVDADYDVFDVDAHPDFGKTGTSLGGGAKEDACPVSSEDVKP